jgi:hypothetical protein
MNTYKAWQCTYSCTTAVVYTVQVHVVLYGTTYSEYAKFRSAPPLFLEDEDIFQKLAPLVLILL